MSERLKAGIELVDEMNGDELSELVDYIRVIFKAKRQQDNARLAVELGVGMRVQFRNGGIKPQYLQGMTGVIDARRNSRLVVKLDRGPTKKFTTGKVVCSPASLIKLPTSPTTEG